MKSGEKRRKKFLHSKLVFISLVETKSGVCTTQAQARRILGGGGVDKHLESYYIVPKFPRRYYYTHYPVGLCCSQFYSSTVQSGHTSSGDTQYRLFFLRSTAQFFTQIYINCFVSS